MPDPTEYRYVGRHADDLSSGRPVGPGDLIPANALRLKAQKDGDEAIPASEHDQRLISEGLLIDAHPEPEQLSGDELQQRAKDLSIEGRSEMNADQLRKAVAKAEREASK